MQFLVLIAENVIWYTRVMVEWSSLQKPHLKYLIYEFWIHILSTLLDFLSLERFKDIIENNVGTSNVILFHFGAMKKHASLNIKSRLKVDTSPSCIRWMVVEDRSQRILIMTRTGCDLYLGEKACKT